MTTQFERDELLEMYHKILEHEGYIIKAKKDDEYQLTEKGKIVLRMVEHI